VTTTKPVGPPKGLADRLGRLLLEDRVEDVPGPQARERQTEQHAWWKVVCLTGADYFFALGYLSGIMMLTAVPLSPIATPSTAVADEEFTRKRRDVL
jgi:hypothetical protein